MLRKIVLSAILSLIPLLSLPAYAFDLLQAANVPATNTYRFGYNSIASIPISGAPSDIDKNRSAMLHDGSVYRLYFFARGSSNTLYQFGYNPTSRRYEYGYRSIAQLRITGAPANASANSFAMLHDGTTYRLYMKSATNGALMYQFGYNPATRNYEFGYRSIPQLNLTSSPADVDHSRWGMLHDGSDYQYYAFKRGVVDKLYKFVFNRSSQDYEYGFSSFPIIDLELIPLQGNKKFFNMLHDGSAYRFYFVKH